MNFNSITYCLLFLLFFGNSSIAQKDKSEFQQLKQETSEIEFDARYIEANKQKMLGNFSDAVGLYLSCLEINPKSTASMFEIARILYSNNDFDGALKLMEKAVSLNKDNEWYLYFLSDLYKQKKDFKSALKVTENIISINEYNEMYYYDKINLYLYLGKASKAEKEFDIIEKKFGLSTTLVEEKIKYYFKVNKVDKAEEMLVDLSKENPDNDTYLRILADLYFQKREYQKSIDLYDQILKISADSASVHLMKAEIYLELYDSLNFVSEFKYVLSDRTIDAKTKVDIVNSILEDSTLNFYEYAQEFNSLLIKTHPNSVDVRNYYASYLVLNERYNEALEHLYFVLDFDKTNLNIYSQLLYIENLNNNWDTVNFIASQALEYYPNQYFLFFYQGLSSFMLENYDEAINSLMTGVNFCPSNDIKSEFYSYIAESYYKLNNSKMSYHFYDKSLSMNENNIVVLNNYSYYLSLTNTSLGKALEMTKKSNKLEPDSPIYLDTYAWVLFKLKKYSEAKEIIEKALSLMDEENGEILEHYGDILYKNGDVDNALIQWKKALGKEGASNELEQKIQTKELID